MNKLTDQKSEPQRPIVGDDGEIISGALPLPDYVPPRHLPVRLSTVLICAITSLVTIGITLTVLGIIKPTSIIDNLTRSLCFSRLGQNRILFLSPRDGANGIFVMNADGTDPCRLVNDPVGKSYPKPSLDGQFIYFVVPHQGHNDIEVVNADGSNQHAVYTVGDLRDVGLAISPDGKHFAVTKIAISLSQLYIMDVDGSNALWVSPGNADAYLPDWSPDGRQITFVSDTEGNSHIFMVNADGTNRHRLTTLPFPESYPAWSPDSRQIVFSVTDDTGSQIHIANADGSNDHRLTHEGTNISPRFSPDGQQIVFAADRNNSPSVSESSALALYVMDVNGENTHRLGSGDTSFYPVWLPTKP